MKISSEDRATLEQICTKTLKAAAEKRGLPLEKIFVKPHHPTVIWIREKFISELELVITLILDSVELEIRSRPDKKPEDQTILDAILLGD